MSWRRRFYIALWWANVLSFALAIDISTAGAPVGTRAAWGLFFYKLTSWPLMGMTLWLYRATGSGWLASILYSLISPFPLFSVFQYRELGRRFRPPGPIQPTKLREQFKGTAYIDLVQEHMRKMPPEKLGPAILMTLAVITDTGRETAQDLTEAYQDQKHDWSFWRRDCAEVFWEICESAAAGLQARGSTPTDEEIFYIFQIVTQGLALVLQSDATARTAAGLAL